MASLPCCAAIPSRPIDNLRPRALLDHGRRPSLSLRASLPMLSGATSLHRRCLLHAARGDDVLPISGGGGGGSIGGSGGGGGGGGGNADSGDGEGRQELKIAPMEQDDVDSFSDWEEIEMGNLTDLSCLSETSGSTVPISSMRVEGRDYSSGNHNDESKSVWKKFTGAVNHLTTSTWGLWNRLARTTNPAGDESITAPLVIPINNPPENKMEGLLGSFYTIADKLCFVCGGLVYWSLQYPGSSGRPSSDDPWMQAIVAGGAILLFMSVILAPLASYLKDGKSIGSVRFKIFKWLLLLMFLGLCIEICIILRICAHIPKSLLLPAGIVVSIGIVLIWAWVFYKEVPQLLHIQAQIGHSPEIRMLSEPTTVIGSLSV